MKIIATCLGKRKEVVWKGKTIITGIYKYPTKTPVFLDIETVKEDAICDRKHHGGIDQAVYAYGQQHYPFWKAQYQNLDWNYGMLGENLTISNFDEKEIHVGSVYKVGEAVLEVTKSRQPCKTLGVRFKDMQIVKKFWNTTKCGVYFKVVQTGFVKTGDTFELVKAMPKNETIASVYKKKREK